MKIAIDQIRVGDRLREDLGDIDELAKSIQQFGLIQPIVVDEGHNLVAGQRRLEAHKKLGRKSIEARYYGELTAAERRALELEENVQRKDLTPLERSKKIVEKTKAAKPRHDDAVSRGGRGKTGGRKAAAKASGVDEGTARRAESHVAAAESWPFLSRSDWTQAGAIKAAKMLDALDAHDRKQIRTIIEDSGPPATNAIDMLETWTDLSPGRRAKMWDLFHSKDKQERSLAITHLAKTNTNPDDRVVGIKNAIYDIKKIDRNLKAIMAASAEDGLNQELDDILANVALVVSLMEAAFATIKKGHSEKMEEALR